MSEVFCRLYRKANSNANLLVASIMINVEYELSFATAKNIRRYMRHNCGPMVIFSFSIIYLFILKRFFGEFNLKNSSKYLSGNFFIFCLKEINT